MSEWREYRLDEIGQVVGGGTPSSKVNAYWNGNVGWVTPADLSGYQFKHIGNGSRDITELGLKKSSAKLHPKNTVLMTSRAPIGYLAIADKPVATNQGFQSIRCNEDIADFNFIYYLLGAYKEGIALIASGATFPEVSGGKVRQYKIKLPPLLTQKKIAKILSSYDDLIENNLKRIKLLEESARLTYEEWFLRFRIDGKKLEIDPETKLPFGWSNQLLNSICKKISSGGTPSRANEKYWNSDDYDWVATKELKDGYIYSTKEKISLLGLENSSAKLFPKSTVVMAIYASPTLGRLGILTKESCFNQAAVGFIVDENFISNEFLYCKLIDERVGLNALAIGAAQQNINVAKVKSYEVTIPDLELLQKFTKVTKPIFNEIENLGFQNQLLKEARDILLPRLMTNVIDTNDMDIAI